MKSISIALFLYITVVSIYSIENRPSIPFNITFECDKQFISHSSDSEIKIFTKIQIPDTSSDIKERNPFEITVVLDVSGSMFGEKLEYSKIAIKDIIMSMKENDSLNLITYSDNSRLLIEKGNVSQRDQLLTKIDMIKTEGGTNLYEGLFQGINISKKDRNSFKNKRVFLFSDGMANVGISDHKSILQLVKNQEIQVNSFGVGSDYDEHLMTSIAREGNGEYFYIDSPQAIKKVVNIVSQSFSNIIGTKTFMQLFLVPGVEIKKIYGIYKEDDKINNVFPINDLRNNDSINIWFELKIQPDKLISIKDNLILYYSLKYVKIPENRDESISGVFLNLTFTEEKEKLNEINEEIVKIFNLQDIVEKEKEIQELIIKGENEKAFLARADQILLIDYLEEEIKIPENKIIAETASRRIKMAQKVMEENPNDSQRNILNSKNNYQSTTRYSKSYQEL